MCTDNSICKLMLRLYPSNISIVIYDMQYLHVIKVRLLYLLSFSHQTNANQTADYFHYECVLLRWKLTISKWNSQKSKTTYSAASAEMELIQISGIFECMSLFPEKQFISVKHTSTYVMSCLHPQGLLQNHNYS